jgi:hypothetical protein
MRRAALASLRETQLSGRGVRSAGIYASIVSWSPHTTFSQPTREAKNRAYNSLNGVDVLRAGFAGKSVLQEVGVSAPT